MRADQHRLAASAARGVRFAVRRARRGAGDAGGRRRHRRPTATPSSCSTPTHCRWRRCGPEQIDDRAIEELWLAFERLGRARCCHGPCRRPRVVRPPGRLGRRSASSADADGGRRAEHGAGRQGTAAGRDRPGGGARSAQCRSPHARSATRRSRRRCRTCSTRRSTRRSGAPSRQRDWEPGRPPRDGGAGDRQRPEGARELRRVTWGSIPEARPDRIALRTRSSRPFPTSGSTRSSRRSRAPRRAG